MNKDVLARSAVAGLMSLSLVSAGSALAQDKKDMEQCWGISKAGDGEDFTIMPHSALQLTAS